MNAKDLITGYYVRLNKDVIPLEKGELLKVVSLTLRQFIKPTATCKDIKGDVFYVYVEDIDPIPLTVDILKAYGFIDEAPGYSLYDESGSIYARQLSGGAWEILIFYTDFWHPMGTTVIYHLHQLQQWLRLYGFKREIEMSSLTSINTI